MPFFFVFDSSFYLSGSLWRGTARLAKSAQLVNEYNLAGLMAWEYGQDMTGSLLKEMSGQLLQVSD
ncbi:MAG: hypothetical protein K5866_01880 [Treponema sp.]|nr:hypothetical protein [Treponema sp.]